MLSHSRNRSHSRIRSRIRYRGRALKAIVTQVNPGLRMGRKLSLLDLILRISTSVLIFDTSTFFFASKNWLALTLAVACPADTSSFHSFPLLYHLPRVHLVPSLIPFALPNALLIRLPSRCRWTAVRLNGLCDITCILFPSVVARHIDHTMGLAGRYFSSHALVASQPFERVTPPPHIFPIMI